MRKYLREIHIDNNWTKGGIRAMHIGFLISIVLLWLVFVVGKKKKEKTEVRDELFQAVYIHDVARVQVLLSLDPDVLTSRPPVLVNRVHEPFGRTSVMVCGIDPQKDKDEVDKDCVKIVKALHKAGANVTMVDQTGWDALSLAAFRGLARVCRYLVKTGEVSIDRRDNEGRTALMKAAANGHNQTYHVLVKYGASMTSQDVEGRTSLHYATLFAIKEESQMGLQILRDVLKLHRHLSITHLVDHHGRNALMYAAIANNAAVIRAILETDINMQQRDNAGLTAADLTSSEHIRSLLQEEVVQEVLGRHAEWLEGRLSELDSDGQIVVSP